MNEWKELKIDNLPPDILTGDYEFQRWGRKPNGDLPNSFYPYKSSRSGIIHLLEHNQDNFRYRKPEPKQPSHEKIWNSVWMMSDGDWKRVDAYDGDTYGIIGVGRYKKDFFRLRQSATIPPEAI